MCAPSHPRADACRWAGRRWTPERHVTEHGHMHVTPASWGGAPSVYRSRTLTAIGSAGTAAERRIDSSQGVRNGLTLTTADDYFSKVLSDRGCRATRGGAGQRVGIQNRPAGLHTGIALNHFSQGRPAPPLACGRGNLHSKCSNVQVPPQRFKRSA